MGRKEEKETDGPLILEDLEDLLKADEKIEAALEEEAQPVSAVRKRRKSRHRVIGAAAEAEEIRDAFTAVPSSPVQSAPQAPEPEQKEDGTENRSEAGTDGKPQQEEAAAGQKDGTPASGASGVRQDTGAGQQGTEAGAPENAAAEQLAAEQKSGRTTDRDGRVTRWVTAEEIAGRRSGKPVSAGRTAAPEEERDGSGRNAKEAPGGTVPASPENGSAEHPELLSGTGRKKRKIWKAVLAAVLILCVLGAAGAYGYGVRYYSEHFLPATTAEGVALDGLTAAEAEEKLTASRIAEDSSMELLTKDGETVLLDLSPLEIRRHYNGVRQALEEQDKWRFFLNYDEPKTLQLSYEISYDREKTEEALKALAICDPEKTDAPVNAAVTKEEETGNWKVLPASDGNRIDTAVLAEAVAAAVDRRENKVAVADTGAYLKAEIREDEPSLLRDAEIQNALDAALFRVVLGADTVYTITSEEFRSLLREEAVDGSDRETLLDEAAFARFLDRLSRSYSTKSGSGYRYFHSITGAKPVLQVDYGWDMNEEETGAALHTMLEEAARKILTGEELEETYPEHCVTAVWDQTAVSHGERDIGESWVEVDITNQVMYCVINGEIVLTSNVVTGRDTAGRRTPTGIYAIRFKSTNRDLVGYNRDGTEAYRSHVSYWMPFNQNIGLHDATWRGSFGGSIYKWNGSHGCVNLPLKTAKTLYGLVYKGMPVVVYQ